VKLVYRNSLTAARSRELRAFSADDYLHDVGEHGNRDEKSGDVVKDERRDVDVGGMTLCLATMS